MSRGTPQPNQKQSVAFIHQDAGLIEWMNVGKNVGLAQGLSMRGKITNWRDTEARAAFHVVTKANVEFDGGPKNGFDPGNDYQGAYKKIWGKM